MIKTEYKIVLEIDDEVFNLVVKEPNLKERKELEAKAENQNAKFAELEAKAKCESALNAKINEINEIIAINKELIKESKLSERITLLLENKKLIKEKANLVKELGDLNEATNIINVINADLESLFSFKIDLLIFGDDKERFLATIKNKSISSRLVWDSINEALRTAQEKK